MVSIEDGDGAQVKFGSDAHKVVHVLILGDVKHLEQLRKIAQWGFVVLYFEYSRIGNQSEKFILVHHWQVFHFVLVEQLHGKKAIVATIEYGNFIAY